MTEPPLPTPTTLTELRALLLAEGSCRLLLTPDLARRIRAHNIESGHPVVDLVDSGFAPGRVEHLMQAIQNGHWDPDLHLRSGESAYGNAIALSPNLMLVNGKHRLRAVASGETPIAVNVCLGPCILVDETRAAERLAKLAEVEALP